MSREPNNNEVICPNCCHQFRAIPVNVQQLMLNAGFEPPFTNPPQQESAKAGGMEPPLGTDECRNMFEEWLKDLDPRTFEPGAYDDQLYKWKGWKSAWNYLAQQQAQELRRMADDLLHHAA